MGVLNYSSPHPFLRKPPLRPQGQACMALSRACPCESRGQESIAVDSCLRRSGDRNMPGMSGFIPVTIPGLTRNPWRYHPRLDSCFRRNGCGLDSCFRRNGCGLDSCLCRCGIADGSCLRRWGIRDSVLPGDGAGRCGFLPGAGGCRVCRIRRPGRIGGLRCAVRRWRGRRPACCRSVAPPLPYL